MHGFRLAKDGFRARLLAQSALHPERQSESDRRVGASRSRRTFASCSGGNSSRGLRCNRLIPVREYEESPQESGSGAMPPSEIPRNRLGGSSPRVPGSGLKRIECSTRDLEPPCDGIVEDAMCAEEWVRGPMSKDLEVCVLSQELPGALEHAWILQNHY